MYWRSKQTYGIENIKTPFILRSKSHRELVFSITYNVIHNLKLKESLRRHIFFLEISPLKWKIRHLNKSHT